jgi:serine/threonine-protein kinase HipA
MSLTIRVYVDLQGVCHNVGTLWTRHHRGRDSASFEYAKSWLIHPERFALEPALQLISGSNHTQAGRALFGAIGDSAPDRWGRVLIQRAGRQSARVENRTPRTLSEADYLLGIGDFTRQGALRFCLQDNEFLAPQEAKSIPPIISLGALMQAARRIHADAEEDGDLQLLLAPGSSLGGARAKASVIESNGGGLAIAKFPQVNDGWSVTIWEMVALDLAENAGIQVPRRRIQRIGDKNILIVQRFDRVGQLRIPFLSAMSMLSASDNEAHSYLEIVDAIRLYGSAPEQDLKQLWRRIVFSILISNTDDHLRNHGFLYDGKGWRLSPAYDLNPTPIDIKQRFLSLAIDEADNTAALELAYAVAPQFGLQQEQAKQIIREVVCSVITWRKVGLQYGIALHEIDRIASAFEHKEMDSAKM